MNPDRPPLPPHEYMALVCGDRKDLREHFIERSGVIVERLRRHGLLHDGARLLDIGCGCGRVARALLSERQIASYEGFDRHPGMIEWCERHLTSRDARFNFRFIALQSAYDEMDGCAGDIPVRRFAFPYRDDAFDAALAASVYTHMPIDETDRYLRELRRVLVPRGRALVTVFFSASPEAHAEGHNFFYPPQAFHECVEASGFDWVALQSPQTGLHQQWFLLTSNKAVPRVD